SIHVGGQLGGAIPTFDPPAPQGRWSRAAAVPAVGQQYSDQALAAWRRSHSLVLTLTKLCCFCRAKKEAAPLCAEPLWIFYISLRRDYATALESAFATYMAWSARSNKLCLSSERAKLQWPTLTEA